MKKYTIDTSDLNLLPIYKMGGNVSFLNWLLNEKQYEEFEIIKKESRNQVKRTENILCHICDIEVPTAFVNDHNSSEKHKINNSIAGVAVERIKKALNHNVFGDIDDRASLHFCPNCVVCVNFNERENHEKTHAHKNSVVADKLLQDFYILYAKDSSDAKCHTDTAINSRKVQQSERNDNTFNRDDELPSSSNIKLRQDGVNGNSIKVIRDSVQIEHKNVISKLEEAKIGSIQSLNNMTPNVTNVSPFCTVNNNEIFCKICKVYVPNKRKNIKSHERGNTHRRNIQITFNNNV